MSLQDKRLARRRRAFTLVEMMVVLVILGLLTGAVTLSVRGYLITAKQNMAEVEISKVCEALETFYTMHDRYPTNQEGLEILTRPSEKFAEQILESVPSDPWGHPYEYVSPGKSRPYDVLCYGADHKEGGAGADKDVTSDDVKS